MKTPQQMLNASAYGGKNWIPRADGTEKELGSLWAACGMNSEWMPLRAVLLHKPGPELTKLADPDAVQMLEKPDAEQARLQHDGIAAAFIEQGVDVQYVKPHSMPSPNLMFAADLLFATPQGMILARPASLVRAGEEKWVFERLAALGIPVIRSVCGIGTFEGADAMWVDPQTVLIGKGIRTNGHGFDQVATVLAEMGVEAVAVDLPCATMHLMGMLRIFDKNLAVAWPTRLAASAVDLLKSRGYRVAFLPDADEAIFGFSLNTVTLGPRKILMPAGNPATRSFYRDLGVECIEIEVNELMKAAGAIGCLTGVLYREKC